MRTLFRLAFVSEYGVAKFQLELQKQRIKRCR